MYISTTYIPHFSSILAFLVGASLKSTLHLYTPASDSARGWRESAAATTAAPVSDLILGTTKNMNVYVGLGAVISDKNSLAIIVLQQGKLD